MKVASLGKLMPEPSDVSDGDGPETELNDAAAFAATLAGMTPVISEEPEPAPDEDPSWSEMLDQELGEAAAYETAAGDANRLPPDESVVARITAPYAEAVRPTAPNPTAVEPDVRTTAPYGRPVSTPGRQHVGRAETSETSGRAPSPIAETSETRGRVPSPTVASPSRVVAETSETKARVPASGRSPETSETRGRVPSPTIASPSRVVAETSETKARVPASGRGAAETSETKARVPASGRGGTAVEEAVRVDVERERAAAGSASGSRAGAAQAASPLQMAAALSAQLADLSAHVVTAAVSAPGGAAGTVPTTIPATTAAQPATAAVPMLPEAAIMRLVTGSGARASKAATVTLDHPVLGRIELEMSVDKKRGMTIRVVAASGAAVAAVRAAESAIRAGIARHGVKLTNMRVDAATEEGRRARRKKRSSRAKNADGTFDTEA